MDRIDSTFMRLTHREARVIASLLFELEMTTEEHHTETMAKRYKDKLIKTTRKE